jgi:hypothetical protein
VGPRRTLLDMLTPTLRWIAGVCLIGIIAELVGVSQQRPVQSGIDAHPVRLSATFDELVEGRTKVSDDTYIVSYYYQEQRVSARLRSLPGTSAIGDVLCVEIDAAQPDHARVCGTRGGLDDAYRGLAIGSSALVVILMAIVGSTWLRRRRGESDLVGEAAAAFSSTAAAASHQSYYGTDLVLRPALATRCTITLLYPGVFAVYAWGMMSDPTHPHRGIQAAVLLTVAVVLAVRCWRLRIECSGDTGTVTLHRLLIPRRVPADQVTQVDKHPLWSYSTIRWQEPSGRRHRARLTGFWAGSRGLSSINEHHMAELARLRDWISANRTTRVDPRQVHEAPRGFSTSTT